MLRVPSGPPVDGAVAGARPRIWVLLAVFLLAFTSIGVRLVQIGDAASLRVAASAPKAADQEPVRRDLVDRNGELLATDYMLRSLSADASQVADPEGAARLIAARLRGVDEAALAKRLGTKRPFVWVKRGVEDAEYRAIMELGLPWLQWTQKRDRLYPKGELFAHAVGYVNVDNAGKIGVERGLEAQIRDRDATGPLALSLDMRVQHVLREELQNGIATYLAKAGNGIVMDVRSGEILAMVSLPDFNPNQPGEAVLTPAAKNRNVVEVYEVGSLFKVFSFAMALDAGTTSFGRIYDATDPLRIGRHLIRDVHAKRRPLSLPEVFMFSSNIGTSRIALEAGAELERAFLERLGMLRPPVVELREVQEPIIPTRWSDSVVATVSFGHTLAVSPLNVMTGFAAIVNGGHRVTPTLLRRSGPVPLGERLIAQRTADDMRWLLWAAVSHGGAVKAQVDGYLVGGKTGTAEKTGGRRTRGYEEDKVLGSFMGAFPIDAPRYAVLVMLDEPQATEASGGERFGGSTSAPIVSRVISRIGPILGVPRSTEVAAAPFRERLVESETYNLKKQRKEPAFAALDLH